MALTFLLGGARSGKSSLAVRLGKEYAGAVVFVATCQRIEGDADLDRRIERHRSDRPDWPVDETPHDLCGALNRADADAMFIVDCLSLWVSNLMLRGDDADSIALDAARFAAVAASRLAPTIVVSNEVGMGVHPESALGRDYRDILGIVNQVVAAQAAPALLIVAGRAVEMHPATGYRL